MVFVMEIAQLRDGEPIKNLWKAPEHDFQLGQLDLSGLQKAAGTDGRYARGRYRPGIEKHSSGQQRSRHSNREGINRTEILTDALQSGFDSRQVNPKIKHKSDDGEIYREYCDMKQVHTVGQRHNFV